MTTLKDFIEIIMEAQKTLDELRIKEAKSDKEILIYFSNKDNSISTHITGEKDQIGFKTIDEAVKEIWQKYPDYNISIIRSDKFINAIK